MQVCEFHLLAYVVGVSCRERERDVFSKSLSLSKFSQFSKLEKKVYKQKVIGGKFCSLQMFIMSVHYECLGC